MVLHKVLPLCVLPYNANAPFEEIRAWGTICIGTSKGNDYPLTLTLAVPG